MKFGFDFDDVIADTSSAFLRILKEEYPQYQFDRTNWTNFKIVKCDVSVPAEVVVSIFNRLYHEPIQHGIQPVAGALAALERLSTEMPIAIITARPAEAPVIEWLQQYAELNMSNVSLVVSAGHDGKLEPAKKLRVTHFVDDRYETCQMMKDAGIAPILFSQRWNADCNAFQRADNWTELSALIKAALQPRKHTLNR